MFAGMKPHELGPLLWQAWAATRLARDPLLTDIVPAAAWTWERQPPETRVLWCDMAAYLLVRYGRAPVTSG